MSEGTKTQRLLAVGGPLHGRVIQTATTAERITVVTDRRATVIGPSEASKDEVYPVIISGDAVDGVVAAPAGRLYVYRKVRVDGLMVWEPDQGAKSKEGTIDALATLAGIERA